jgi:hypothetical protein
MKKSITLIAIMVITRLAVIAQTSEGKTRIILGWGAPNFAAAGLSDVNEQTGPIHVGFKHFFSEKLSVGAMYNYSDATTKNYLLTNGTSAFSYNYKTVFSTFLTNIDYTWANKEKYNLYTGLGLGYVDVSATATITDGSGTAPTFTAAASGLAYHLTAIGVHYKLGSSRFGGYAELGFGYNGIVNAGLSYSIH